jgi:hypothetical protein
MNRCFAWIRDLSQKLGRPVPSLPTDQPLAMHPTTDPFFCTSQPAAQRRAYWFAEIWKKLSYEGKVEIHLRRLHYRLVDAGLRICANIGPLSNMVYRLNKDCWEFMQHASRVARYMGLVPADAFDDRRNGEPEFLPEWESGLSTEPHIDRGLVEVECPLPEIRFDLGQWNRTILPPIVTGYDADDYLDRPYLCEIWIEKSTQNDILVPLCQELEIGLVTSVGYQSITSVVKLLQQRVAKLDKPARIFYISDADANGHEMPKSTARQIEFWLNKYAIEADVKLIHLALTQEQIEHYRLPRDDKGGVELDALEARVPGELDRLVREAVEPYFDPEMGDRLQDAQDEADDLVGEQWAKLIVPYEQRLKRLNAQVETVAKRYQKEVQRLQKRLAADLAPFRKPLSRLDTDVRRAALEFGPELPGRPEPETDVPDESDWLFASSRDYLEQMEFYQAHKAKKRRAAPTRLFRASVCLSECHAEKRY